MRTPNEQLIHMANQIAENNLQGGAERAAKITCTHIQKFWARSMKEDIMQHLKAGGQGLSDVSIAAIKMI